MGLKVLWVIALSLLLSANVSRADVQLPALVGRAWFCSATRRFRYGAGRIRAKKFE